MTRLAWLAAGFFAGAGFRGYRLANERHHLDAGWRGGWPAVRIINVACFLLAIYFADRVIAPPDE